MLADVVSDRLLELDPLIREKGHQLSSSGMEAVPPVVMDLALLRQVLINLITNAIKYTPAGGKISIVSIRGSDSILWSIQDNGIGIPKNNHAKLFEKFSRGENAVRLETEGTGLGLCLVRLIVEHFKGQVWFESEEGRGSIFFIRLPYRG